MFHYFSPDDQCFDDLYHSQKPNPFLISTVSDYDLGGEGDLFKAPEPIIEQPLVTLDHMTSAMSLILCGEEVVSHESLQSDDFPSNPFFEYKYILANEASSPSEVLNFEFPTTKDDMEESLHPPESITKSATSISLGSVDGAQIRPSCVNFNEIELKEVRGMRRVSSEGYIKLQLIGDHQTAETRSQKLSRYRDKKTKRNFGRKIKYACRKVLADGQPRIRGRFAKTEETDILMRK
ncbi:zinc finger protein CONSTANS-LIKE 2-like [Cynara cardunculus var. scolymus]|uniref:zinc finger protein CONSTANS-LIKE 2-like n=1 Tax=Cynara cardunculus var. scolymus TaxID=59895 RepID=UPI000D624A64|nr:zinc finger protein CONSTANS-LIKE 2-like [Cynara cardunculus var. scolymus]